MADVEQRLERIEALLGNNPEKLVSFTLTVNEDENIHYLWATFVFRGFCTVQTTTLNSLTFTQGYVRATF